MICMMKIVYPFTDILSSLISSSYLFLLNENIINIREHINDIAMRGFFPFFLFTPLCQSVTLHRTIIVCVISQGIPLFSRECKYRLIVLLSRATRSNRGLINMYTTRRLGRCSNFLQLCLISNKRCHGYNSIGFDARVDLKDGNSKIVCNT